MNNAIQVCLVAAIVGSAGLYLLNQMRRTLSRGSNGCGNCRGCPATANSGQTQLVNIAPPPLSPPPAPPS